MTKFLPFVLAAALVAVLPSSGFAATHLANSGASKFCSADAPESYKRPGGFCDQLDGWKSLNQHETNCGHFADAGFRYDEIEGRMVVAAKYSPCCNQVGMLNLPLPPERILVAIPSCN